MKKLKIAAIGTEHRHIFGQLKGMLDIGYECVGWWNDGDNKITNDFKEKYPAIKRELNKENLLSNSEIDLVLIADIPIEITLFCKTIIHWFSVVIPLIIITPIALITFQASSDHIAKVVFVLFIGSPSLSFVGTMISCLTLSNRSSFLLTTITIPFYFPTLLLGVFCCSSPNTNLFAFEYLLLYANTLFTVVLSPYISAYAIKLNYS